MKMWIERFFALLVLILLLPLFLVLMLLIILFSGWPIFFIQKRVGLEGKFFDMYKFRTMRIGAEEEQRNFKDLNEANGPVFKIKNDPRFTSIGKFLCHSGLDELPQFVNILKGEMSLIGPRPLPVIEEKRIPLEYRECRKSVLPGIISVWVVNGYHRMEFNEWMRSDITYIETKSVAKDVVLLIKGGCLIFKLLIVEVLETIKKIFV